MGRAACEEKEWGNGGPGEGESPLNGLHMFANEGRCQGGI